MCSRLHTRGRAAQMPVTRFLINQTFSRDRQHTGVRGRIRRSCAVAIYYIARYEDAAKIAREAKRIGWQEGASSLMDELDVNQYTTARRFADLDAAEAWLIERIKAGKTFFGVGDLLEVRSVEPADRCRYCQCDGERRERSWHVEEDGRYDERGFDDCWEG